MTRFLDLVFFVTKVVKKNQRTAIQMNVFSAYPKFCFRCLKPLGCDFFAISAHSIEVSAVSER